MQEISRGKSGFNTPAVVLCGLALVIFLYAVSLFLQGGFLASRNKVQQVKLQQPVNEALQTALAAQQALLDEQPRWLDEEHTKACLPIAAAMARVVARNGGKGSGTQEEGR